MVSREEEPPHTSHHGAREISFSKNKEYKKEQIFYMDERERKKERETERVSEREKETEKEREETEREMPICSF